MLGSAESDRCGDTVWSWWRSVVQAVVRAQLNARRSRTDRNAGICGLKMTGFGDTLDPVGQKMMQEKQEKKKAKKPRERDDSATDAAAACAGRGGRGGSKKEINCRKGSDCGICG